MIAYAITGFTGTGKTHEAMQIARELMASEMDLFVFDYAGQWLAAGFPSRCCFNGTFKDFAIQAKSKKDCVIVYEEGTKFLKNPSREVREAVDHVLQMKRHMWKYESTKKGCVPIFLFISNRKFPLEEVDGINYWIMKKTNDFRTNMVRRFGEEPKILQAFDRVKADKNIHAKALIELMPPPTKY